MIRVALSEQHPPEGEVVLVDDNGSGHTTAIYLGCQWFLASDGATLYIEERVTCGSGCCWEMEMVPVELDFFPTHWYSLDSLTEE